MLAYRRVCMFSCCNTVAFIIIIAMAMMVQGGSGGSSGNDNDKNLGFKNFSILCTKLEQPKKMLLLLFALLGQTSVTMPNPVPVTHINLDGSWHFETADKTFSGSINTPSTW